MNTQKSGKLIKMLALAVLFLAACQPAVLETRNPPAGPAATAVQPLPADTEAPASEPTQAVSQPAPTSEGSGLPPNGEIQVPEGWQVFDSSTYVYSLAYPTGWEICQETKYSRAFCEIRKDPEAMGPPPRLYVSVVQQGNTNQDWEVYNYTSTEIVREFLALPVGESKLKEPDSPMPEYGTYTRLPDQMVAGWTGLVIENTKIWDAPSGTKQREVFIVTEGATYNLGTYYETPEQLATFEQVLASFQFVP